MTLELQDFIEELKKEGVDVSVQEISKKELADVFATKCSCSSRCASCSGCKSRSTIIASTDEQMPEQEKIAA